MKITLDISDEYCCQCCKPIEPNRSNLCPECYNRCVDKAALMRSSPKWRENINSGYWRKLNDIFFQKQGGTEDDKRN